MNKIIYIRRQKGVFAIEFALGFIVLFMFTMLIFETCRLTYICSVLDYATAEAARDARVQLEVNTDFRLYNSDNFDCNGLDKESEKEQCKVIQSFGGDEYQIWFYSFVLKNGGALWKVLSSEGDFSIKAKHYKNIDALTKENGHSQGSNFWKKNAFTLYEIDYLYQPLFFKTSWTSSLIKRYALVIEEFERHANESK